MQTEAGRKKPLSLPALGMILLAVALAVAGIRFLGSGIKDISVFGSVSEADKYQIRSKLLMDAMQCVGVCEPEKAVTVWANGLESRSAAMQYSVMSRSLKSEYARQLEQSAPNWVTGVSSPWVEGFSISETKKEDENRYTYKLRISLATSTGSAGDYNATLTVIREDGFWRISKIEADAALYPYTGFKPTAG